METSLKLHALIRSARRHGVLGSLALIPKNIVHEILWYLDRGFDREHGTDTSALIHLQRLTIDSGNAVHGNAYEPSSTRLVRAALRQLQLDHGQFAFVDLGSGKGRTLLLAAEYPFRKIVGVEFSRELHEVAVRNIGIFRSPRQRCRDISSLHMDATAYALPADDLVIYLFNPFKRDVLMPIVDNIRRSLADKPRRLAILYYHPTDGDLLERQDFLPFRREIPLPHDWTRREQKKLRVYSNWALPARS